jgi:hypothetical protein
VGYENKVHEKGERLIWLEPSTVDRLRAMRGPGESYSDVVTTHQFNSLRKRAGGSLTVCPPPEEALTRLFCPCPSSDDLRQFGCFRKGGSGSSVVEIKRHAGDAANDDLRWSGV